MAETKQVVKVQFNQSKALKGFKFAFTNSDTVLSELMQNGRRAGASQIHFDFDEKTGKLVVTDDGEGITDFQTLLTVAESGWNEDIQEEERPFGMGFLSALFAAEEIKVSSRGQRIHFRTSDALELADIAINDDRS